ncbi:MAG: PstS family phosphate ABC transporter substrate-binding protein [Cytophagaceae bacterium]
MIKQLAKIILCAAFLSACSNNQDRRPEDTPVSGELILYSDPSFEPLVNAERLLFEGTYAQAAIKPEYIPETDAIRKFVKGETDFIVAGRLLTDEERNVFKSKEISIREHAAGRDAIAFAVHPSFPDSAIDFRVLRKIFEGEITSWKQVNKSYPDIAVRIVADQNNSGNIRVIHDSLGLSLEKVKVYGAGSNPEVFNYVAENPWTIGITGVGWISDAEDRRGSDLYKKIKVLGITKDGNMYLPFQGNIADGTYPLIRNIYLIYSAARTGLGTGFASFILNEKGQRLVQKKGLVPVKIPSRDIEFKYE